MLTLPYGFFKGASGGGIPVTTDLWGHFDAGLGVTKDGSNLISEWQDQSGNGNHFTQSTGADQPLFVSDAGAALNNKPGVSFDGGSMSGGTYMTQARSIYDGGDTVAYDYTIMCVWTDFVNSTSQYGRLFWSAFSRSGAGLPGGPVTAMAGAFKAASGNPSFWGASTGGGWNYNMYSFSIPCFNSTTEGLPHILTITANDVIYKWGTNVLDGVDSCDPVCLGGYAAGGVGTTPQTHLNRGDTYGTVPAGGLTYKLAELIIYNAKLSDADRDTMNTYLNDKYLVY